MTFERTHAWRKSWYETRTRFFLAAAALAWVCLVIVLTHHGNRLRPAGLMSYNEYVWQAIYKGYARDFFTVLLIVLGGGSLLQECARGTAGFTLSLPVRRSQLVCVRALVGLAELAALALVPAFCLAIASPLMGENYPLAQSLQYSALWFAGGSAILAAAFLASSLIAGEYSAWAACFLAVMLYAALLNVTALHRFPRLNIFNMMSGSQMPYFNPSLHLLSGSLPWLSLGLVVAVSLAFFIAAAQAIARRDF